MAKEPHPAIGVAIATRPEAQLAHPRDLGGILGEVRLHRQVTLGGNGTEATHKLVGAGGRKARCNDRGSTRKCSSIHGIEPEPLGSESGLVGTLSKVIRGVAVHAHLAHAGNEARGLKRVHQGDRSAGVHGAEDDSACSSAAA